MKITFWDKAMITNLSDAQRESWFDVYNHELEQDRGINIEKLNQAELESVQATIKQEYFQYLESLIIDKNFQYFTVLTDQFDNILSLCRLIKREGSLYIGGLETHRDHRNNGYARQVLSKTVRKAFNEGYSVVYSVIRVWNKPSIKAHERVGFRIIETKGDSVVLSLGNISFLSMAIIEEFMGDKVTDFTLMSDHFDDQDHDSYFDFRCKENRYVAKMKSASKEKTSEIFKYIKSNQTEAAKLFESKAYGYTHKFHIHGRDYWLWVENYKQ